MYATATATAPQHSRPAINVQAGLQNAGPAPASLAPVVASTDLLQGRKAVEISHNGFTYRLQATRLGKLILTK